jgi:hypothetical protein
MLSNSRFCTSSPLRRREMPAAVGHRMLSRLLVDLSLICMYKLISVGPPITRSSRHVGVGMLIA